MANFPLTQTGEQVQAILNDVANKAPLASPAFTGNPTTPTPAVGDNDTSIANTEFVNQNSTIKTGDTGASKLPSGTTAQRPASPSNGYIRYNTETTSFEGYSNGTWSPVAGGQMLGQAQVKAISYNAQVINENITVPANVNASMVGPVTIGDGYTLTIETGARVVVI